MVVQISFVSCTSVSFSVGHVSFLQRHSSPTGFKRSDHVMASETPAGIPCGEFREFKVSDTSVLQCTSASYINYRVHVDIC